MAKRNDVVWDSTPLPPRVKRGTTNQIVVRKGKGDKDHLTMLPTVVKEPLTAHLVQVRALHQQDLARGFGKVALPDALDRK